jgi:hypothetical protein
MVLDFIFGRFPPFIMFFDAMALLKSSLIKWKDEVEVDGTESISILK